MAHGLERLLLIRERDVGLFSTVLQVMNTLHLLEAERIDRVPVAVLGRGLAYFHPEGHHGRRTVWEYYFEPLTSTVSETDILEVLGDRAIPVLESKRKELELTRGAEEFPDQLHLVAPLTDEDRMNLAELDAAVGSLDWAWTESFRPTVDGRPLHSTWIPEPNGAEILRRHVRPREYIRATADEVFEANLEGFHVIGVHVRGTDGHSAAARGFEIPFDRYFSEIDLRLASVGPTSCRVFLATDEHAVVTRFEARYGELLVLYDAVRADPDDAVFGAGPTGQVMPGYVTQGPDRARRNGEDAVVEYALLCRSDYLIHNVSSLSMAARRLVSEGVQV